MTAIYKSEAGCKAVEARYREILAGWPVPNEQFHVPTRHGETFVVACGPKDAPPVLLLHGSGANAAMWMSDIPSWSRNLRLYAIDMIGEPGLSAPSRPPLGSDAHAQWLDDVYAALSLSQMALVGVSLGGLIAADYASRRPDQVRKLVLLCPGGIGRQKNFLLKAFPLLFLGPWGRRKLLEMVLGPPPANPAPETQALSSFVPLIFTHFRPRMERLPQLEDAALKRLCMPLLAILGGRDALLDSRDTQRRLIAAVPHAEIRFLPEAGHFLPGQTGAVHAFLET